MISNGGLPSADLDNYHLMDAVRADSLRRVGSPEEAAQGYKRVLVLITMKCSFSWFASETFVLLVLILCALVPASTAHANIQGSPPAPADR